VGLGTAAHTTTFADELTTQPSPSATSAAVQGAQRVSDVKRIFIPAFGNAEGSDLIREKLINRLTKTGMFTIVDSADKADATLIGTGEVQKRKYINGAATYSANVDARLTGKDNQILWTGEGKTGFLGSNSLYSTAFSVSSSVADKLTKALVKTVRNEQANRQIGASH